MLEERNLKYVKVSRNLAFKCDGSAARSLPESGSIPAERKAERKNIKQPKGYSKTEGVLSAGIICVISGGTTRERAFLNELERKHSFRSLEVVFVSSKKEEGGLTPRMMMEKYTSICQDGILTAGGRKIKLEAIDSVYMFTDVDHYEIELKGIIGSAQQIGPRWIISNPDFEIWIYYCFRKNPQEDLSDIFQVSPSARSSLLKTINGRFNNGGGLDPRKAFEHLEDGIQNARQNYSERDGFPCLLSTQMYVFAEDVLQLLGEEYRVFVEKIRIFRDSLRQTI